MAANAPLFATVSLFAALLLLVGIIIGLCAGSRPARVRDPGSLDDFHAVHLLRGLSKWTNGFAQDVSQYQQLMQQVQHCFRSVAADEVTDRHGPVVGMLAQIVHANDQLQQRLERAEEALTDQAEEIAGYMSEARTDTLTGLPNRRVFHDELKRRIAELRRHGTPLSVLLVDIDFFKRFNDQHGHQAGDAVLEQVAQVLRETVRESDLVARLGGEEFAAVLPGAPSELAGQTAERLRQAIDQACFRYEETNLQVTISCGVAEADAGEAMTSLVKRADEALYASKAAGRNFAHCHDGQKNVPLTKQPRKDAAGRDSESRPEERQPDDDDFHHVCEELRQRLLTVVNQETQSDRRDAPVEVGNRLEPPASVDAL